MADIDARVRNLSGTPAEWLANDLVPLVGEIAFESDNNVWRGKVGDGVRPWSEIPYTIGVEAVVNNMAELRLLGCADLVYMKGYYTPGDGGGGYFYFDNANAEPDDGGLIILPTGETGSGRWVRIYTGGVRMSWFGVQGSVDETAALRSAVAHDNLVIIDADLLVDTFDIGLDDATSTAVELNKDIRIESEGGKILSNNTTVSNSVFGVDGTSGVNGLQLTGVIVSGAARFRLLNVTESAVVTSIDMVDCVTSGQSIVFNGEVISRAVFSGNKIGVDVTAASTISPFIQIFFANTVPSEFDCQIVRNVVTTGTEVVAGAYVIHDLPIGSLVDGNSHYNLGKGETEGYDIDRVGPFTKITNNTAVYSGFEYKVNTEYKGAKNIIFTGNVSYESWTSSFSFRSTGIFSDNIAYNPDGWGFFCRGFEPTDLPDSDDTWLTGSNNVCLWAGDAGFSGGFGLGSSTGGGQTNFMNNVNFDGFQVIIDAEYAAANPGVKMPVTLVDIRGDCNNIRLANGKLGPCSVNQILSREATNGARWLVFENINHGDTDDSCYDLGISQDVRIINPMFPDAATGDRPVRFTGVDRAVIECAYNGLITLAQVSGGNTGILINNWGQESAGAGNPPSAANGTWPVGCIVRNNDDQTIWIREDVSTNPTSAWTKIAG